jgi:YidC/Oxa1 family membrane protein insertase
MDWQRNLLISAIVAVLALLFIRWNDYQADNAALQAENVSQEIVVPEVGEALVAEDTESLGIPTESEGAPEAKVDATTSRLITLASDTLEVTIDTYGGDIVKTALIQFPLSQTDTTKPVVLLNRTSDSTYIAQSGLIGTNGTDTNEGRPKFKVVGDSFTLKPNQNELVVDLVLEQGDALVTKQFVLRRGDYLIDVNYLVENKGSEEWSASFFGQIQRDSKAPPAGSQAPGMAPYLGAAITTPDTNYKKVEFSDLEDGPVKTEVKGGWVAMVQHYFISAWVPDQAQMNKFTLRPLGSNDLYSFGFVSPTTTIAAGESGNFSASFYVGPKDQYRLEAISPYLDLTVDYGWLWWIAKPIFYVMTFIHSLVGNWGWSIILLTVLIKALFFKLSATSYRSMAKMRKLQPEMARLRDLYGDDRQKLSQEMMSFYKKEKVNPMGGCLPILIQMPVFIALYWVLSESVELRQAPWILWITDLSIKDPYYVLPVLNGICMYVTTLLQPEPPDPTQAKVMKIMPVAFSFMFAFFPAGLVAYWTINSLLSILQQWVITKKIEANG